MIRGRRLQAAAGILAAAVLLTACGGNSDGKSVSDSAGGSEKTTNSEAASQVKDLLAGNVDFPVPSGPVDPGSHHIAIITAGLASPGPSILAQNAADAVKAIGWTADAPGDGKFTPTTQAQLIQQAVLDKVDGILLVAITPSAVDAAVKAADSAHIPVVCALCGPTPEGMVAVGNDPIAAGDAQAAYAASVAKPGDTVIVYQNTEFVQSQRQMAEAAKKVKEYCPKCNVETPSLLLAESVKPNAPIFTSLLDKYPAGKVSSVLLPFDTPASVLANTAQSLGRTDFNIVGLGALAPFIGMVGAGAPVVAKADVLLSTPLYGWASVDEMARILAGTDTWKADAMPVGLVDKSTYANYDANNPFILPKDDWKGAYKKLWGK